MLVCIYMHKLSLSFLCHLSICQSFLSM
jgi:hypothetical protein